MQPCGKLCLGGSGHPAQRKHSRRCGLRKRSHGPGSSLKVDDLACPVRLFFVAYGAPQIEHGGPVACRPGLLQRGRLGISNDGRHRDRSLAVQADYASERLPFSFKGHFEPRIKGMNSEPVRWGVLILPQIDPRGPVLPRPLPRVTRWERCGILNPSDALVIPLGIQRGGCKYALAALSVSTASSGGLQVRPASVLRRASSKARTRFRRASSKARTRIRHFAAAELYPAPKTTIERES